MLAQKFVTKLLNLIKFSSLTLAFYLLFLPVTAIATSEFAPLTSEEIQKLAVYVMKNGYRASSKSAFESIVSQRYAPKETTLVSIVSQGFIMPAGIPIYNVGPKINH